MNDEKLIDIPAVSAADKGASARMLNMLNMMTLVAANANQPVRPRGSTISHPKDAAEALVKSRLAKAEKARRKMEKKSRRRNR